MTGKQARSQRTRIRILDAAAAEFARHGYPDTNLQRVADDIGLTKGALYGHFVSKRGLADALMDHAHTALTTQARSETEPGTALSRLRTLVLATALRLEADVQANAGLRLTVDRAQSDAGPAPVLIGLREAVRSLLDEAVADGELSASAPGSALTDLVVAVVVGVYFTAPAPDRLGMAARTRRLWDLLLPAPAEDAR
jgi:AcrR family transcriptional regulator